MNTEIISNINRIIATAEGFKNAYFWSPPGSASGRRSYERKHSIPEVSWNDGKHKYTARYDVTCSCHNIYAKGTYTRDGNKTTLTAIKNSLKRLESEV